MIPFEPDIGRKTLRASSCKGTKPAKLPPVTGGCSTGCKCSGRRTRLLPRLRLLSMRENNRRSLLPRLLSLSRPYGPGPGPIPRPICCDSFLETGCKILDFFRASAAAFDTSSAFKRAKVHGLIFTGAGFFFFMGSSIVFFPNELTEPESCGTTSYCKKKLIHINIFLSIQILFKHDLSK